MIIGKFNVSKRDVVALQHSPIPIEPIKDKDAEGTMKRGIVVLEKMQITHWLSSGNLLGIYRDKKLIPHDTDIDVNVVMDWGTLETNIRSKQLLIGMDNHGFELCRSQIFRDHFMQMAFVDRYTDVIFDIFFFYRRIVSYYAVNINEHGFIKKPLKFINKPEILSFHGFDYPIPRYLEEFMVWRFGKDWETPATRKREWQDEGTHLRKWV